MSLSTGMREEQDILGDESSWDKVKLGTSRVLLSVHTWPTVVNKWGVAAHEGNFDHFELLYTGLVPEGELFSIVMVMKTFPWIIISGKPSRRSWRVQGEQILHNPVITPARAMPCLVFTYSERTFSLRSPFSGRTKPPKLIQTVMSAIRKVWYSFQGCKNPGKRVSGRLPCSIAHLHCKLRAPKLKHWKLKGLSVWMPTDWETGGVISKTVSFKKWKSGSNNQKWSKPRLKIICL